ncbi:adenylate kinase [Cohnella silvisoli]|uniref:Adenylate kinase n=1 Tax=Cohnella silvisoli TaxID=2873699 RepID=A0ABV1KYP5_9BACL|nr:adenylate kinase [Cohnella silvisoli]
MIRKLAEESRPKSMPPIALCGQLRAGKDAVADYLGRQYGYTRFAFGDELKRYAHELFSGEVGGIVDGVSRKPRELYQWFGQTMRARDPDIWVRKCFAWIQREYDVMHDYDPANHPFRSVITDLRQPNEIERCRAEGYVIIRVNCPEAIRLERARQAGDTFTAESLAHETESHIAGFAVDYEVENAGTMADLYAEVDAIMARINAEVNG